MNCLTIHEGTRAERKQFPFNLINCCHYWRYIHEPLFSSFRTPSYNPQINNYESNLKYNFELARIFSVLFWTILLTSGHNLKLNRVGQRGILKSVFYHYSIRLAIFKFYIVKFKHCDRGCQISCPTHRWLIWRPCWGKTTRVDSYQLCFQEARTLPNTKHNLEKIIL